ncbi:MAG: hypothetical protein HYY13_04875 [Nitrospirae bacterium]|nr:hypothetical protein [Nitrospirota bacterium]
MSRPFRESLPWRWLKMVRHPRRIAHALAVAKDYQTFRGQLGRSFRNGQARVGPSRNALILCIGDYVAAVKMAGFLGKALQLHGLTPVVVTERPFSRIMRYFRLFGIEQVAFFDDFVRATPSAEAHRKTEEFFQQDFGFQTIKNYSYRGVNVGRHALSGVTRSLLNGTVDLKDPQVRELLRRLLRQVIRNVAAAEALMDRFRPDLVLVNETGYPGQGEIYEVALNRGINTTYWENAQKDNHWNFKRYTTETRHLQPFSLSDDTWSQARSMPWTNGREARLMEDIRARYEPRSAADSRQLQKGKLVKSREKVREQLHLDPGKKTAVIFSHITWDASFFHGTDLFDGYEEWLVEALKAACANRSVNWIVKLHPANLMKLQSDGVKRIPSELVAIEKHVGTLPPHVKLLFSDTDINTFSLFDMTDYCLTVRGTIGIEMACFGIPVLTAGTGRYSGRGFTIDFGSREDYLAKLARIHEIPRLAPEQVELAKKHAYGLFLRRQVNLPLVHRVIHPDMALHKGHPLDSNIIFDISSPNDLKTDPTMRRLMDWMLQGEASDFCAPEG